MSTSSTQAYPRGILGADDLADDAARAQVVSALHSGAPAVVFQPILGLAAGRVVAYESLARFTHGGPSLPPDVWFSLAHRVGLGPMLEARAIEHCLRLATDRPPGTLLSVNVSPSVLGTRELEAVLPDDLHGLQFEITEREAIEDSDLLGERIGSLRERGAKIAVDDVGEGYAGLQRVMKLEPDLIKLDRALVAGVEQQRGKAALISAVVEYAAQVGARVCAEGVENLEDLYALAELDVSSAQGWVVGMPVEGFGPASEAAVVTCEASFAQALAVGSRTHHADGRPTLEHVIGRLADTADLDSLARLMPLVADVLFCDETELSVLDPTGQVLEAVLPQRWQKDGVTYVVGQYPVTQDVLQTQQMSQVLRSQPCPDRNELAWMAAEGWGSLLLVPVVSAGRAVGLLECCHTEELPWTRHQVRQARAVASVLGPVLSQLLDA
jgi:EAL domain-containing protein (putative c-di-GMP-specific phosphodiesterase class I)